MAMKCNDISSEVLLQDKTLFNFIVCFFCVKFLANQDSVTYLVKVGKPIQQSLHKSNSDLSKCIFDK